FVDAQFQEALGHVLNLIKQLTEGKGLALEQNRGLVRVSAAGFGEQLGNGAVIPLMTMQTVRQQHDGLLGTGYQRVCLNRGGRFSMKARTPSPASRPAPLTTMA